MNLKQAAQYLGVHYQTAYKLVRSGRLAAVSIGARYEISEASIERYLAERRAMRRTPLPVPTPAPVGGDTPPFAAAAAALDAPAVSSDTVIELVTEWLATNIGDLAVARELSRDGETFLPAVIRHTNPCRRSTVAATIGDIRLQVRDSRILSSVAHGTTVLYPIVAQDCIRTTVDPEAIQYFDDAGFHSMIVAPAPANGAVVGLVSVSRDAPGRPYTREDAATVERGAALVGAGIARARLASASWDRRRFLVTAVANLLDAGETGLPVHTVLGNGPVAEVVCDTTGRIVARNDAAVCLLGRGGADIVGRRLHDIAKHEDRDRQQAILERLLIGDLSYLDTRIEFAAGPGTSEPVAVRFAIVRDARSHPRAIVVTAHAVPSA